MTDRDIPRVDWPTARDLAARLRSLAGGGLACDIRSGEVVRTPTNHMIIDAADLLEHMVVHLEMIADDGNSPVYIHRLRAANGLHWNEVEVAKIRLGIA